jgi:hypothetical protein
MFKKKVTTPKPVEIEVMSKGEWMQKYWRPCAAFMYMICCLADFAVFPIMFTVVQFWETEASNDAFRQWVPITLQGGGLFHVSMCAVLGVSAYGRTQEKLAGQSSVPDAAGLPSPTLSSATPAPTGGSNGFSSSPSNAPAFGAPAANGFGASSSFATAPAASGFGGGGFGSAPTTVATTASGKKIVPDADQPLL